MRGVLQKSIFNDNLPKFVQLLMNDQSIIHMSTMYYAYRALVVWYSIKAYKYNSINERDYKPE